MSQTILVFVINLDRRADRLQRINAHLADRGVTFHRQAACDAHMVPEHNIAKIVRPTGPLGPIGLGDRACTVSHTWAWAAFLDTGMSHALFLEDDIYLAHDLAPTLATTAWIPPETHAVKLEKYNEGASRLLLAAAIGKTPMGRALHPLRSRHVGGGAYILSRRGAEVALRHKGRYRVPVDHFLFNNTVSPIHTLLNPTITVPAMATQRMYTYDSDIAPLGKAARPTGWRKRIRTLRRGMAELNQAPRQVVTMALGRARFMDVRYQDHPFPNPSPT